MTSITIRKYLYNTMEKYLENMCAYHATGDQNLFRYYAGKADACRDLLEVLFDFNEHTASEHIKNMWEIMDANW